jgi:hypothetical protein
MPWAWSRQVATPPNGELLACSGNAPPSGRLLGNAKKHFVGPEIGLVAGFGLSEPVLARLGESRMEG